MTPSISLDTAPRDPAELAKLNQGVLYRLGLQLELFPDDNAERAFLNAPRPQQAQIISASLVQRDQTGSGRIDVQQVEAPAPLAAPMMQPPQAMAMPQMPAVVPPPAAPQAPPQMPPQMGQQGLPFPAPGQQPMGISQMPIQAPPFPPSAGGQMPQMMAQMGMQQPMAMAPQMPQMQPQMRQPVPQAMPGGFPGQVVPVGIPGQPGNNQMQMPMQMPSPQQFQPPQMQPQMMPLAMPQMPPPAAQPQRQPSTTSDPGNAGSAQAAPQVLTAVLQKLSKSQEATQKWLEELQQTLLGQTRLMQTMLAIQLQMAEQNGVSPDVLSKMVKQVGEKSVADFMTSLLPPEGKGA